MEQRLMERLLLNPPDQQLLQLLAIRVIQVLSVAAVPLPQQPKSRVMLANPLKDADGYGMPQRKNGFKMAKLHVVKNVLVILQFQMGNQTARLIIRHAGSSGQLLQQRQAPQLLRLLLLRLLLLRQLQGQQVLRQALQQQHQILARSKWPVVIIPQRTAVRLPIDVHASNPP